MGLTYNDLPQAVERLSSKLDRIEKLLLSNRNQASNTSDSLLTVTEVAEWLPIKVPTIYGLVSRLQIPHMKKGKRLYFSKSELVEWIKSGKRQTRDEIADEAMDSMISKKYETKNK